jgi:hypothetical protein
MWCPRTKDFHLEYQSLKGLLPEFEYRSTRAEIKLLNLLENDYVSIPLKGGEYQAIIPAELMGQYGYYLPPELRP